ncbi:MAG: phage tail sheath family protein [Moorea sp. SIO1G6]|uniref:phage tail sheath family protein n=1 Tax=Moorena sp. SIO1G6 TaxID=2607840 RepID=UPI0013C196C7|nr:phage tail sheath subtilisin-like domain-containing protein [Moorena sp. SIO1G6]NET63629.1 phage tail sheath family protein [Moorena sp. SIO1G6]
MPTYLSPGVYVEEVASGSAPIAGVGTSTAGFVGRIPDSIDIPEPNPNYDPSQPTDETTNPTYITTPFAPVTAGEVKLCTNFSEFKKFFGNFSLGSYQRYLVHAVYGFFNNGGTRCYVVRVAERNHITAEFLEETFGAIDEIAMVAVPGIANDNINNAIITHCQNTQDRFAILDSPSDLKDDTWKTMQPGDDNVPGRSDYAAFYFPWIKAFDPTDKIRNRSTDGLANVPPSGHLAGIYARVDQQRGVHKAPANETIRGALGLQYNITKAQQEQLNKHGINCIRNLNGNIRVWGARTLGGDANGEFKYINVRRLFNYLRESIDEGTQWIVFEPNNPELWAQITRNVNAFLTNVWSTGALFGNTPEEAFYVKCDEETNPPEVRDLGQLVTEIGVAVTKPAEFVVFRLSQWTSPSGS